jgi:hypothetical protein
VAKWKTHAIDGSRVWKVGFMNYYVKLILIIIILLSLSEFFPEWINTFLILVILSMLIMQGDQYARLVSALKL